MSSVSPPHTKTDMAAGMRPPRPANWGTMTRETNIKTGNSEEGGHVDIQIEVGSEFFNELELIQSHMAQKPVLRGEVGCACVARKVSVERGGMGERGCGI